MVDGSTVGGGNSTLTITLPSAATAAGYTLYFAPSSRDSDPSSWLLQRFVADRGTWITLDSRSDAAPKGETNTEAGVPT